MKFIRARQSAFVVDYLKPHLRLEGVNDKEEAAGYLISLMERDPVNTYVIVALEQDKLIGFVLGYAHPATKVLTIAQLFVQAEDELRLNIQSRIVDVLVKNLNSDVVKVAMLVQNRDVELMNALMGNKFKSTATLLTYSLLQEDEILLEIPLETEVNDDSYNNALRQTVTEARESIEATTIDGGDGRNDTGLVKEVSGSSANV